MAAAATQLLVVLALTVSMLVPFESMKTLRRSKRRWVLTTIVLEEGDPGPFPKFAGELFNDRAENMSIKYLISGPGVDEYPEPGLFTVDDTNGHVFVNRKIDREKTPLFVVRFDVADRASGKIVDNSLIFNVEVKDINDNAPKFEQDVFNITVKETVNLENPVIQIQAKDIDKVDTPNSEVAYSLVSQTPPSSDVTFSVDTKNGLIRGKGCLNYETSKMTKLVIRARDNGTPQLTSSTTVNIIVEDGNNYMPVIVEQKYEGKVNEGEEKAEITRIKVQDKDTPKTAGWRAKFKILSGNEHGNYDITTDPSTNEGVLSVVKPIQFNGHDNQKLVIAVENEEPFAQCDKGKMKRMDTVPLSSTSVNVNVVDVNNAPHFSPGRQVVREKEGAPPGTVLGACNATDPDIVPNKIRYKVAYDPEGWVTVDEHTGVITSVKELDRESPYVNNSIYTIVINAIDDGEPPETGTGTVLLYVSDINDHTPYLLSPYMEVCDHVKNPSLVVQAADKDLDPFAGPFSFEMKDETKAVRDIWRFGKIDDNSAEILLRKNLPKGNHSLSLNIYDRQGHLAEENLVVRVCSCPDFSTCERMEPAAHYLGGGSIAVILASLLLFLLALFLITCLVCGSSRKHGGLPPFDDGNQTLIKYNEEGGSALSQASPSVLASPARLGNDPEIYFKNRNAAGASPIAAIKGQDKNGPWASPTRAGALKSQDNNDGWSAPNRVGALKSQDNNDGWSAPALVVQSSAANSRYMKSEKWGTRSSTGLSSPRQSQKDSILQNGTYAKKTLKANSAKDAFSEQIGELVTKRLHGLRDHEYDTAGYKPHIYAYEGELERMESVDSLSLGDDMNNDFLDHLGSKFAALGEICQK